MNKNQSNLICKNYTINEFPKDPFEKLIYFGKYKIELENTNNIYVVEKNQSYT